MKRICIIALCGSVWISWASMCSAVVISGNIDYEDLFIDAFHPGTGSGISIDANNNIFIGGSDSGNDGMTLSDSAFALVDLNGDLTNDIRVDMSYAIHKSGDSRIGFRQNAAGTALTMFSDSNTGIDYDYGFMSLKWQVSVIGSGTVDEIQDISTGSLNGNTELYEFGIIDTANAISASDIIGYDARRYTGDPGSGGTPADEIFSGAPNSLGDADELLLPEHLGSFASVTYDAEATIVGDLSDAATTGNEASDSIGVSGTGQTMFTLWYGGFDVGTNTSVGNPTASLNFTGDTVINAVPEPSAVGALLIIGGTIAIRRRRRA